MTQQFHSSVCSQLLEYVYKKAYKGDSIIALKIKTC